MDTVYVLTRIMDGDVVIDGVFTTEKKADDFRDDLIEQFDDGIDASDWEIHEVEVH